MIFVAFFDAWIMDSGDEFFYNKFKETSADDLYDDDEDILIVATFLSYKELQNAFPKFSRDRNREMPRSIIKEPCPTPQ